MSRDLCMECRFSPKYGVERDAEAECERCSCNWGERKVDWPMPICLDCTQEVCRRAWTIMANGLKGTCSGFVSKRALEMRNAGLLNERGAIKNG